MQTAEVTAAARFDQFIRLFLEKNNKSSAIY
jgi:hypothetical protein